MKDPVVFTLLAAALSGGMAGSAGAVIDWRAAESEYRALLAELIAADTSNPPGNEILVARILKAKLEAEGLPVYIESRVQIGPFRNRKEAEAMREKLKADGVATVFIAQ